MTAINVYQRDWAFTSKDTDKPIIKTGSFGPCCVVTFASEQYAAMTHMDLATKVNSLTSILNEFQKHGVEFKNIKVVILGGWKDNYAAERFCNAVIREVRAKNFESITESVFLKKARDEEFTNNETLKYYHFGAQIDARTGCTDILQEPQTELNNEQARQTKIFLKQRDISMLMQLREDSERGIWSSSYSEELHDITRVT